MALSESVRSRLMLAYGIGVITMFLVWNILSTLGGWRPQGYLRIGLDSVALIALIVQFRYAQGIVKIWSAIPFLSLASFLLASGLRHKWSANPNEHIFAAVLTLPMLLWISLDFRRSSRI